MKVTKITAGADGANLAKVEILESSLPAYLIWGMIAS